MNTPVLPRPPVAVIVGAATLSAVIAAVLLVGLTELFVCDGLPLQHAASAERACSGCGYVSEREACVQALLAATYHWSIASR